jgi:hypothetical protein
MDADCTNVRRLTENTDGEAFAALSPDGKGSSSIATVRVCRMSRETRPICSS